MKIWQLPLAVLQLSGRPVAKFYATYKMVGRPRYYQILVRLATQSPGLIVPDDAAIFLEYFYVGQPKICLDHPTYQLGGPLGDPGFFVSCSTATSQNKIVNDNGGLFHIFNH